jgi:diguanylate cyclase (GGDEF)-like protein/PAS domain S-box-containing protein
MLRATLKGWRYAMDNPEEIIELLKTKYDVSKSREHMRFEEQEMRKLIFPDLIQLGHMNDERWHHMAHTFIKAGVVEDDRYLEGFVYDPNPSAAPKWLVPALLAALALLSLTSAIAFYLHRFNRRMALAQTTLQESEERFRAISAATYGGIVIHDQGVILECNDGMSDITGFSYAELIGMDGLELIAPAHMDTVVKYMREDYRQGYEVVGLRKDGSQYPLAIKGKNITYKSRAARVIECLDITEQKQTQDQLKLAASVFTHAREGIMITDVRGNIIEVNDTFTYITGYSREEAIGKNPRFLSSGLQSAEFYQEMWHALDTNKQWSGELWNSHKSGRLYAELITISAVQDGKGNTQNYVALFSDITPMKEHQQQLEHIAHYDSLTNLPNRMLLADRLQHAMNQCERRDQSLAVAYLDLDGFKAVNDAYGHNVGDELLIELAKLMSESLREGDTLARIGGDEFVAVLVDIDSMSDCELVLDRLLAAAMSRVEIAGRSLQVSTSIGVTLYPQDGVDADQLLRHADQAMYIAKQTGKNRYHLFDVHHDKSIQTQHETVEHIQRGLDQDEFVLYYQPKVNMRTGDIVGVEALIRWQHPERGLVFPGDFLPIIENHPISLQLGEWVIDRALDQMVEWQSVGLDVLTSVNIDAYQLQQPGFAEKLATSLAKRPSLKPNSLQLEILETSALGDMADVTATMHACINSRVSFSLDDFGTGFSSLTYLKRLPVEVLKIDQSFVRDMLEDADDRAIVKGVISMASAFNHQVIAEGVETIDHGTQLLSMGCELAQGYGIARPMRAEQFPGWAKQWQPAPEWATFTPRT